MENIVNDINSVLIERTNRPAGDPGTRTPCRINDLLCALVDEFALIRLELNADSVVCHFLLLPNYHGIAVP